MTEDEKREFRSPSGAKTKDEKAQANGRKTKARKENVAAARDLGRRGYYADRGDGDRGGRPRSKRSPSLQKRDHKDNLDEKSKFGGCNPRKQKFKSPSVWSRFLPPLSHKEAVR